MSGSITERLPGYIEAEPRTAAFDTLAELLAVDFVSGWRGRDLPALTFYRYSLEHDPSGVLLIAEYNRGQDWFVIGQVTAGVDLLTALPRFTFPPEAAS